MTLIEGIGDEVIQFFIAFIFILIASLAWYTTNISNEGTLRTVFLLERRRLRAARRLTNHTESATIVEGTAAEELDTNQSVPVMEEDKPPDETCETSSPSTAQVDEETRIVEAMDAPRDFETSNDLRRRRLAFYNKCSEGNSSSPSNNSASSTSATNFVDQNTDDSQNYDVIEHKCSEEDKKSSATEGSEQTEESADNDRICVKLMYLNDEMRHVEGRLHENLGDFKRRHFQVELAANKFVKLIFNGHVLQPDTNTLQSCGMFDNCVVHCLVHQRSNSASQASSNREGGFATVGPNSYSNNNNQAHEWHLENYLFGILCCFLGAAWYLRYVYSHLYTVTATIGLILMTGIFTIIMYGMHYPDRSEFNQQRTENVHSHQ